MNTRKKADVGLGAAISYFTSIGYPVSIPLSESQRYDLVIDNGDLKRVEIKSTEQLRDGVYIATLKTCGGNKSRQTITLFDSTAIDILFVWTPLGSYCIPANDVTQKQSLALGKAQQRYLI
jgi:hypothetical protein